MVELPEDNPLVIAKMIEYLYISKYESVGVGEGTEKEALSELRLHAELYAVADKYGLPSLADHAKSRFIATIHDSWDPYGFLESINAIYTLTPGSNRGLRDVAVARTRLQGKKDFPEGRAHALMKRICLQVPEYAFDIVDSFMQKPILGRCRDCGPNQKVEALQLRCLRCGKGGASEAGREGLHTLKV
jgi:hypothetical protein